MIKLGLLGQGIAHSLSPQLYREYIGPHVHYELIDVDSIKKIPTISELRSAGYQGLNITTPWKEHFVAYAAPEAQQWGAVNCLKITAQSVSATNTDATALAELIPRLHRERSPSTWIVLGDGVMARIALGLLKKLGYPTANYSRRKGDNLTQLDLTALHPGAETKIVINACGRGFEFAGNLDGTWVFWDFNYAHMTHEKSIPARCREYIDGRSLLETQAQHAVKFWELQDKNSTSGT